MSTNATILVEGVDYCKLYKHWDGYEDATLPWLKEFNEKFTAARGDDPIYKMAQLIRSSVFDGEKFELDLSKDTGWGVTPIDEYEGEYEYLLKIDGTVTVKRV